MQVLTLSTRQGWRWFIGGFLIFRKNPPLLTVLIIAYWVLMAFLNLVPVIGSIVATICIPAFSVGLMNACRRLETADGAPPAPLLLFSGFGVRLPALLLLGAGYLLATLAILSLSALADAGALMQFILSGKNPDEAAVDSGSFLVATQLALVFLIPLVMAYWYAPVLVAWHGFPVGKALFFSFVACLRNWRAFLAYGLSIILFGGFLPGIALALLGLLFPQGIKFLTAVFSVPLLLILAPTLYASFYVSYRDVFVGIDENA